MGPSVLNTGSGSGIQLNKRVIVAPPQQANNRSPSPNITTNNNGLYNSAGGGMPGKSSFKRFPNSFLMRQQLF